MAIPADDLEDAREALRAAGRDADAFRFEYVPYPRFGCGAGPPPADVILTDTTTGARRIYRAGPGSNWLRQLRGELEAGGSF
jgi:hypothetical protein